MAFNLNPELLYACFKQQIIYTFSRLNVTFGDYMKAIIVINHTAIDYSYACAYVHMYCMHIFYYFEGAIECNIKLVKEMYKSEYFVLFLF